MQALRMRARVAHPNRKSRRHHRPAKFHSANDIGARAPLEPNRIDTTKLRSPGPASTQREWCDNGVTESADLEIAGLDVRLGLKEGLYQRHVPARHRQMDGRRPILRPLQQVSIYDRDSGDALERGCPNLVPPQILAVIRGVMPIILQSTVSDPENRLHEYSASANLNSHKVGLIGVGA